MKRRIAATWWCGHKRPADAGVPEADLSASASRSLGVVKRPETLRYLRMVTALFDDVLQVGAGLVELLGREHLLHQRGSRSMK